MQSKIQRKDDKGFSYITYISQGTSEFVWKKKSPVVLVRKKVVYPLVYSVADASEPNFFNRHRRPV